VFSINVVFRRANLMLLKVFVQGRFVYALWGLSVESVTLSHVEMKFHGILGLYAFAPNKKFYSEGPPYARDVAHQVWVSSKVHAESMGGWKEVIGRGNRMRATDSTPCMDDCLSGFGLIIPMGKHAHRTRPLKVCSDGRASPYE
jgi:hypothetical protein